MEHAELIHLLKLVRGSKKCALQLLRSGQREPFRRGMQAVFSRYLILNLDSRMFPMKSRSTIVLVHEGEVPAGTAENRTCSTMLQGEADTRISSSETSMSRFSDLLVSCITNPYGRVSAKRCFFGQRTWRIREYLHDLDTSHRILRAVRSYDRTRRKEVYCISSWRRVGM